ncbi:MAG: hypothetical protein JSW27_15520 [Phycisphaerales bacterium]|nr:MAG: hypothetical protein JSW27_15520 [Phycisphaerales bacterium]
MKDENSEARPKETTGVPTALKGSGTVGERRCPLCGGLVKEMWRGVSTFVSVAFCICLFLTPVLLFTCLSGAGTIFLIPFLLCAGIAVLSFWAMPAAGAMAVVARPCCRSCGHLFPTASADSHQPTEAPFPRWPAVGGSLVLLATLVACLVWLRTAPGLETGRGGLRYASRVVVAGFVLNFGLLAQTLLWRRMGTRIGSTVQRGLLLLVPAIVLCAAWLGLTGYDHWALSRKYDPVKRAPQVLDRAGLAALPPSARNVKVHSWAFMLSGQFDLRFTAEPNEIEQFLADSPSLKTVTCKTYSRQCMLLRGGAYVTPFDAGGYEVLPLEPHMPSWYRQELRGPGRRYEVSWHDDMYQGELLVDDETDTVYVHVDRY